MTLRYLTFDELLQMHQVCRTWKGFVQGSINLQRTLFKAVEARNFLVQDPKTFVRRAMTLPTLSEREAKSTCTIATINPLLSAEISNPNVEVNITLSGISSKMLYSVARDMFVTQPPCGRVFVYILWNAISLPKDSKCDCILARSGRICSCRFRAIKMRDAVECKTWVVEDQDGVRLRTIAEAMEQKGWDLFKVFHGFEFLIDIPSFSHRNSQCVFMLSPAEPGFDGL